MTDFFQRLHKPGTTAITKQDIKISKVSVPVKPTLNVVASPSSTKSLAIRSNPKQASTGSAKLPNKQPISTPSKATRDGKGAKGKDSLKVPGQRKSLKRKESSSSVRSESVTTPRGSSSKLDSPDAQSGRESVDHDSDASIAKRRRLTSTPKPSRTSTAGRQSRNSPTSHPVFSSSDEEASDGGTSSDDGLRIRPDVRGSGQAGADTRDYLHPKSFKIFKGERENKQIRFVHAEQIANVDTENYRRLFPESETDVQEVSIYYPAMPLKECYALVAPKDLEDEFSPLGDIITTVEIISDCLLTSKERIPIISDSDEPKGGILHLIKRGGKRLEADTLLEGIERYNQLMRLYRKSGVFRKNIEQFREKGGLPPALVKHIIDQSYARTVATEVDSLRQYQAWGNNVYGELLPKFTGQLFKETSLSPDKIFVDLGSGTGNVVLHAALEVGCESWGCEIMEKACVLAAAQRREFEARLRLWGINAGEVHLEEGDFLENEAIAKVLPKADVLLVNNFVFEPSLNERLLHMFLDLKEGAKIISLKPFVPANHAITTRNLDSPVNLLRQETREYFSGCVSWTDAPGKYYIATVDRSQLKMFLKKQGMEQ